MRALAAPAVFNDYARQFEGPSALNMQLGDREEWRIKIINVRLASGVRPGVAGDAVVTYQKEVHDANRGSQTASTNVATIRYEYRPRLKLKEKDRIDNPFGFVATAYRSDPEINTIPSK